MLATVANLLHGREPPKIFGHERVLADYSNRLCRIRA